MSSYEFKGTLQYNVESARPAHTITGDTHEPTDDQPPTDDIYQPNPNYYIP